MRSKGDCNWGPLDKRQQQLADQHYYLVGVVLGSKRTKPYIERYGHDEVESILGWYLCRACWYYDSSRGMAIDTFIAFLMYQGLHNQLRLKERPEYPVDPNAFLGMVGPDKPEDTFDPELWRMVGKLTRIQRYAIMETVVFDKGTTEVGKARGVGHGPIINSRRRGLANLRKMLAA